MGMNLLSCCHKCKTRIFHYRKKEDETLLPFYKKHYNCMRENAENLETREDQIQYKEWMDDYTEESMQIVVTFSNSISINKRR